MTEAPLKGSYRNGLTLMEWEMPDYSQEDLKRCARGDHKSSRRRVVNGWLGFSQVERYYCACGARLWMRYEGFPRDGGEATVWEPGAHRHWIEDMERDNEMDRRSPYRSEAARWWAERGMKAIADRIEKSEGA